MINAKVKIFHDYGSGVETSLNGFLKTIDVRQIIKIDSSSGSEYKVNVIVTYIDFEDIRDLKIDSIIDQKVM